MVRGRAQTISTWSFNVETFSPLDLDSTFEKYDLFDFQLSVTSDSTVNYFHKNVRTALNCWDEGWTMVQDINEKANNEKINWKY